MFLRLSLALLLGLAAPGVQPSVPDTPAGRTFKAWLDAFNSGDRAQIAAYVQKYQPKGSVDGLLSFRTQTGGFELLEILKSEPLYLEYIVKERRSDTRAVGKIDVKNGEPAEVANFMLLAIPPGTSTSDINFNVDATARARVIDGAIANLNEYYVDAELAKKMEEALRARQKRGEFDSVTDGGAFATLLTNDLQEVSHDKHLRVDFNPAPFAKTPPSDDPAAIARFHKDMERMNCGFDKVEILPGNVGYLKFDMFADPEVCGPTAVAAMNFLANADAIIFDLRENGGGDPKMIALISTYLFSKPTHLNDLWERKGNSTHQYWTLPYVPGKRLDDKPAYVLTAKRTFSGAEEFAYNLKNLKRATIVGETTGGGAHPVSGHRLDDHFMIGVPDAKAINPISNTNWEGTGVEPDVKVPAADALSTAQNLAKEKLSSPQ
jgi:hypothetical protein